MYSFSCPFPTPGFAAVAVGMSSAVVAFAMTPSTVAFADGARVEEPPRSMSSACATADAPRTLADVLERIGGSARLDAVAGDVAAATALEEQAAARPNPELEVELEDFTGSGRYSSFGESQTTVSVSQPIELGGRRARRVEVAVRETGAEKARGVQATLKLQVAAKQAFVALIAARQRHAITARAEGLARETLADARRRVEGGAASSVDMERASIAAATAALAVADAERTKGVAAQKLAGLWGGPASDAFCIDGELALVPLRSDVGNEAALSPAVAIAEAEVEVTRAEVARARAESSPNIAMAAGIRHLAGPDDVSLVAGFNVELPLFDRNAGNIRAAEQRLFAAQARARVARDEAALRIARARDSIDAARARAAMLTNQAIPAAERVFATLTRAWRDGAVSSFEMFEARRTLVNLRLERVDALVALHDGLAALEGARGVVAAELEDTDTDADAATGRMNR